MKARILRFVLAGLFVYFLGLVYILISDSSPEPMPYSALLSEISVPLLAFVILIVVMSMAIAALSASTYILVFLFLTPFVAVLLHWLVIPNVHYILLPEESLASVSYTHLTLPTTPYV